MRYSPPIFFYHVLTNRIFSHVHNSGHREEPYPSLRAPKHACGRRGGHHHRPVHHHVADRADARELRLEGRARAPDRLHPRARQPASPVVPVLRSGPQPAGPGRAEACGARQVGQRGFLHLLSCSPRIRRGRAVVLLALGSERRNPDGCRHKERRRLVFPAEMGSSDF